MGRAISAPIQTGTVVGVVPVGGVAPVFRSGDAYKAVGELVQRSLYPALSAAFPRNGSFYAQNTSFPVMGGTITVQGIASGNGVFVAACGDVANGAAYGFAAMSYDGQSWFSVKLPATGVWVSIAFGLGLFVIIDRAGQVLTSPDGQAWTARTSLAFTAGQYWSAITFGGTKFVAVNGANTQSTAAASSTDGITFTPRTLPSSAYWAGVFYGGGLYIAYSTTSAAATSADGITWVARTLPDVPGAGGDSVAYGNAAYVFIGSAGDFYRSTDGISWTAVKVGNGVVNTGVACFGNGLFLVVAGGVAYTSTDGLTWRRRAIPTSTIPSTGNGIAFMAGVFVALQYVNVSAVIYAENSIDSDYLYLAGTAGSFVRVK